LPDFGIDVGDGAGGSVEHGGFRAFKDKGR
jgi:hypothetical protein